MKISWIWKACRNMLATYWKKIFSNIKGVKNLAWEKSNFLNAFKIVKSEKAKLKALLLMLTKGIFFPVAFHQWIYMWIFCWLSYPASNAFFFLALLNFWQTKDLPVQSERPSYPPPLFLSPCVNYGNCGLVLHYQDPRVHPMSRRAQEQQQHSVRFPPSPISQGHWFSHSVVTTEELTWCYHTAVLISY